MSTKMEPCRNTRCSGCWPNWQKGKARIWTQNLSTAMSASTSKKQIPIMTAKSIRYSSTTSTKSNDSSHPLTSPYHHTLCNIILVCLTKRSPRNKRGKDSFSPFMVIRLSSTKSILKLNLPLSWINPSWRHYRCFPSWPSRIGKPRRL